MLKYNFAVFVWQPILISIISKKAEFDSFSSRLMLRMLRTVIFICKMNSTVSAGCPTLVTITPSTGTFEAGNELTCTSNGYNPTYMWTGTAGVNGAIFSETGVTYTLPDGPFNVTCTANVSQLPAPCRASETVSDNAYSKYEKQYNSSNICLISN